MFVNKQRKINQLKEEIHSISFYRPNELDKTLDYFLGKDSNSKDAYKFEVLIYLQKIICNSIQYGDFAYASLSRPHSAPKGFDSNCFRPRNSKDYKNIDLYDNPVFISGLKNPIIACPWNNQRIVDNIRYIGKGNNNKFDSKNSNIDNVYIYPLGIVLVNNGNHSQLSAVLKNEFDQVKINRIYDISLALKNSDSEFSNFYGYSRINNRVVRDKWISLMKIGSILGNNKFFPPEILNNLREEQR